MQETALKTTQPSEHYSFTTTLARHGQSSRLTRAPLRELQINLGRLCNQACHHCHVDAGPKRTEIMTWETMERILAWAEKSNIQCVDLTGGAPELNPSFRRFVDRLLAFDLSVISRCNLTVLLEPGQEDLATWYAERGIRLVCSLPCYTKTNVDAQRGDGVFDKSIVALKQLNAVGYGREDRLPLDLVYNPGGAFLPGDQAKLEAEYKERLKNDFGIEFSHLLTLTNLPINRFAHYLKRTGAYASYMQLLHDNFNSDTIPELMCRHLVSVDWLGQIYDCDFNQMLDLPLEGQPLRHLWDITAAELTGRTIAVGKHCLGCTAGSGSSCGGSLVG